jgi:hypothetical protein
MTNIKTSEQCGVERTNVDRLRTEMSERISACRGGVLSLVEAQLAASPNWKVVRGQLLRLFGERGLSGEVD